MANYDGTSGNDPLFPFLPPLGPLFNDGQNDSLRGFGGDDRLGGKDGRDTLRGGTGNDTLDGDDGNDSLDGGDGLDVLHGGLGRDTLLVNDDSIQPVANRDFTDLYQGGEGDDLYLVTGLDTRWRIDEKEDQGSDTVRSASSIDLGGPNFFPENPPLVQLRGGGNVETLILTGTANLFGVGNSLNNRIEGNTGNNVLIGSSGSDTLFGLEGNDTLVAGFAFHLAEPRSGDNDAVDRLLGGVGDDMYVLSDGSDQCKPPDETACLFGRP